MEAVAHGWHKPGGGGPTKAVAEDFLAAGRAYFQGGTVVSKSSGLHNAAYASGGPVLGKTSEFLKTPDEFTGRKNGPLAENATDEDWGKGSGKSNPKPKDKSEKPVKPRS